MPSGCTGVTIALTTFSLLWVDNSWEFPRPQGGAVMRFERRRFARVVAISLLGFTVSLRVELAEKEEGPNSAAADMDEQKRALHARNLLTFGPRRGVVEPA